MKAWLEALIDLFFPPRCPECQREKAAYGRWCESCRRKYALNFSLDGEEQGLLYVDKVTVLADYSGAVRKLLKALKYGQRKAVAAYLQTFLPVCAAVLFEKERLPAQLVMVPVPIHQERFKERGYNQTCILFEEWAIAQGIAWQELLQRVKPTLPQYALPSQARRDNLKGAFQVTRPAAAHGQTILLVDDIFTSGVTLDECAHQLRQAGAAAVFALVLASSAR